MIRLDLSFSNELFVCLDTETTGLGFADEVCQLGVVNFNQEFLFDELIRPTIPIPEAATAIHHITNSDVQNKQGISYWWDSLMGTTLYQKVIIGYNVFYDIRMLMQSIQKADNGFKRKSLNPIAVVDVMQLYQKTYNSTKWMKLNEACEAREIKPIDRKFHDASFDSYMTMGLFKQIMKDRVGMKNV
jgi:DNA polymerase-3 subunit epsilon